MGFDATQQFNTVIPSCFVDNFKQSLSLIKIFLLTTEYQTAFDELKGEARQCTSTGASQF